MPPKEPSPLTAKANLSYLPSLSYPLSISTKQSISVSVSVLTLTCISIDRWYAICRPLEFSSTKYRAKVTICLIWLASLLFASPNVVFLTTRQLYEENGVTYTDCTYDWPEVNTKLYQLCIAGLLFIGPFVLMTVSYSHIVNVLWRNEAIADCCGPNGGKSGPQQHLQHQHQDDLELINRRRRKLLAAAAEADSITATKTVTSIGQQQLPPKVIMSCDGEEFAAAAAERPPSRQATRQRNFRSKVWLRRNSPTRLDQPPLPAKNTSLVSVAVDSSACHDEAIGPQSKLTCPDGIQMVGAPATLQGEANSSNHHHARQQTAGVRQVALELSIHDQQAKATSTADNSLREISDEIKSNHRQPRLDCCCILLAKESAARKQQVDSADFGASNKKYRRNLENYASSKRQQSIKSGQVRLKDPASVANFSDNSLPRPSQDNLVVARPMASLKAGPSGPPENSSSSEQLYNTIASANDMRFYKLIESRKKAAKMLIVIVIMFGLCYLPVHFLNILR